MQPLQALTEQYIAIWNTIDASARRELIAETLSATIDYRDPLLQGDGHAGIDALIAGVQAQFPEHTFRLKPPVDAHSNHLRFSWEMFGPHGATPVLAGTDFAIIEPGGRIESITGFLDLVPVGIGS